MIRYAKYLIIAVIAVLVSCTNTRSGNNEITTETTKQHEKEDTIRQWLEKFDDQKIFAINIRQEYNSSTYADDGYLFLLVDMTDTETPLIKVRTW